jgi:CYTH domain-containing protein
MPIIRKFLVSPSLTRVIRKEYGAEPVLEGHFAPQFGRQLHVGIENGRSYLVLTLRASGAEASAEATDVSTAHAEALLRLCPGTLLFERSVVRLRRKEASVKRFVSPGPLDVVSVPLMNAAEASAFVPPAWFGVEISENENYANWAMAISGVPRSAEAEVSNAGMESLLDMMDGYTPTWENNEEERLPDSRRALITPAKSLPKALGLASLLKDKVASILEVSNPSPLDTTPDRSGVGEDWLAKLIQVFSAADPTPSSKTR